MKAQEMDHADNLFLQAMNNEWRTDYKGNKILPTAEWKRPSEKTFNWQAYEELLDLQPPTP